MCNVVGGLTLFRPVSTIGLLVASPGLVRTVLELGAEWPRPPTRSLHRPRVERTSRDGELAHCPHAPPASGPGAPLTPAPFARAGEREAATLSPRPTPGGSAATTAADRTLVKSAAAASYCSALLTVVLVLKRSPPWRPTNWQQPAAAAAAAARYPPWPCCLCPRQRATSPSPVPPQRQPAVDPSPCRPHTPRRCPASGACWAGGRTRQRLSPPQPATPPPLRAPVPWQPPGKVTRAAPRGLAGRRARRRRPHPPRPSPPPPPLPLPLPPPRPLPLPPPPLLSPPPSGGSSRHGGRCGSGARRRSPVPLPPWRCTCSSALCCTRT